MFAEVRIVAEMTSAAQEVAKRLECARCSPTEPPLSAALENSKRARLSRTHHKAPAESLAHSKRFAPADALGSVLRLVINARDMDAESQRLNLIRKLDGLPEAVFRQLRLRLIAELELT